MKGRSNVVSHQNHKNSNAAGRVSRCAKHPRWGGVEQDAFIACIDSFGKWIVIVFALYFLSVIAGMWGKP